MSFRNCINTAAAAGIIDRAEAEDLIQRFDRRAKLEGPTAARDGLERELAGEAARREQLRVLSEQTMDRLDAFAQGYRRPDGEADVLDGFMAVVENRNNRLAGTASVAGRRDALRGLWRGRIEQMLFDFRRKAGLGTRRNRARMENMAREAFNEGTGDAAARDLVAAYRAVNDEFIDMFNAAGGALDKRKNYFPQRHDARAVLAGGRDAWKAYILPRLDLEAMGGPGLASRIDDVLDRIWGRIVTDGALDREPGTFSGLGALANRREDHRFFIFKNGDAWLDYNRAYGGGDIFRTLTDHLDGLAKDIAALEVLGPNPHAMIEWMKQYIEREAARKAAGGPGAQSLFRGAASIGANGRVDAGQAALERIWGQVNGGFGVENMAVADAFQATRSFLRMVNLSSTALTAVGSDPFQQAVARKFAGIRQLSWFPQQMAHLFRNSSRREIVRAGVLLTQEMHDINRAARHGGWLAQSAEMARWLEDRIFIGTGLTPWTRAGQATGARAFMFEAGDRTGQTMAQIAADGGNGARFARWLEGFGIGADEWDVIRKARPLDHDEAGGMLRMVDIIDSAPDDTRVRDIGLRYGEAIHAYMEEHVPQGTSRVRAMTRSGQARGNLAGELKESSLMYLSYPLTVFNSLLRTTALESGGSRVRGAAVFGSVVLFLAVGGAMQMTLRSLARGEDPPDFSKPGNWLQALARGGGGGVYGDYLLGNYERGGVQTAARVAGPVVGFAADVLAAANILGIASGKQSAEKAGKRWTRFGQRYTPVQNMWWLKPVTQRMFWDQLEAVADPGAWQAWRTYERKLQRENNQGIWWARGEATPRRMPDFGGR